MMDKYRRRNEERPNQDWTSSEDKGKKKRKKKKEKKKKKKKREEERRREKKREEETRGPNGGILVPQTGEICWVAQRHMAPVASNQLHSCIASKVQQYTLKNMVALRRGGKDVVRSASGPVSG